MQYQPWMFKAEQWSRIPKPYPAWNVLGWYVVSEQAKPEEERRGTAEQIRFFDYTFAIMLQKETGWN